MSIEALVNRFGLTLYIYRPTTGVGADGEVSRAYARISEVKGFVDPGSESSAIALGRANGQTSATIYIAGSSDVRIDDEIRSGITGTVRNWRVDGAVQPGETFAAQSASHLTMTVVMATEVDPGVTL
jgi:hypothetical protein